MLEKCLKIYTYYYSIMIVMPLDIILILVRYYIKLYLLFILLTLFKVHTKYPEQIYT